MQFSVGVERVQGKILQTCVGVKLVALALRRAGHGTLGWPGGAWVSSRNETLSEINYILLSIGGTYDRNQHRQKIA